jgi:signal transduction histidine kinase
MSYLPQCDSIDARFQSSQPQSSQPGLVRLDAGPPSAGWASGAYLESFANLAHELRTPVQVLFGYLDILRDERPASGAIDTSNPLSRKIIERMNANVHELAQTVENVLDYALALSDLRASIEEAIDIPEFFAEIDEVLGASMCNPALTLRINLDGSLKKVLIRRRALRSIVLNLANNALKFTAEGKVTITVGPRELPPALCIEVRDTGQGISRDLLSAAFEPLVQLSNSSIRRHRGLGLGLTLVDRNVKSLGGRLRVESEPGVGSCFTVTIPCSGAVS